MARSWKYYQAKAEQFRAHNVFTGPLRTEESDRFVHYMRQGKLGDGTDYFGVYCEDHASWLKVQPKDLLLQEVDASTIPPNPHVELERLRLEERLLKTTKIAERDSATAATSEALELKGLAFFLTEILAATKIPTLLESK